MIRVSPFRPDDLMVIAAQPGQPEFTSARAVAQHLGGGPLAFTARDADSGEILFCGGATEHHPGYASLWSVFAHHAGPALLEITRRARRMVADMPHGRVDCLVRSEFEQGMRWAWMIGLQSEGRMRAYWSDGSDAMVFARIRG